MKFSFQIHQLYVRLGDFTGLTRNGYPFGGPSPDELSLETLEKVNSRWEEFYTTAYPSLMYFARNDEDLVQHGMLAVRGKLCLNPDVPISHLITCAKGEILTAISGIGASVDTHGKQRQHPYKQEEGRRNNKTGDWQDVFEYAVATSDDSDGTEGNEAKERDLISGTAELTEAARSILIPTRKEYLTTTQVAQYLGIDASTVRRHIKQGKLIPAKRVGNRAYFEKSQIEKELPF